VLDAARRAVSRTVSPLILSTNDIDGGAARATYRLHEGLKAIGVPSRMLVQYKLSDDATVQGPAGRAERILARARPGIDMLPVSRYPRRHAPSMFSPNWLPETLLSRIEALNPDVVHLHWVAGGFLRIEHIPRFRKPLVWTLHDMWAFTGGCHYDRGCGRYSQSCGACPILGSERERDLSHRVWQRKERAFRDHPMVIVSPSRWLADCARKSSLFQGKRIEVIPYGLDLNRYKPIDRRAAREILGLPQDKRFVLFGASNSTADPRKGFQFLKPALDRLGAGPRRADTELLVFGASRPAKDQGFALPARYLGRLHDDISLALYYGAADVFAAPSTEDNLPNTILESLACGTPCVAFDLGGMPDMVTHQMNGYLARAFEPEDLARGLEWVLEDRERWARLTEASRAKAVMEYALERQGRDYLELYRRLVSG
jgi:glycosyltransferase involved in cell wall biosynthesis